MIRLLINNQKIEVKAGTNLLKACLDHDIYIPNLCYIDGMKHPPVSCRLCFVEIEGWERPVAACSIEVTGEMTVYTDTPRVRHLQRSALQLLLSVHRVDCRNCPANRKCVLQDMARFLKTGLKPSGLDRFLKEMEVEDNHPFIVYHPNRCVLCGRCVYACRRENGQALITFAGRGFDTRISFFEMESGTPACNNCRVCIDACPVAALTAKSLLEADGEETGGAIGQAPDDSL